MNDTVEKIGLVRRFLLRRKLARKANWRAWSAEYSGSTDNSGIVHQLRARGRAAFNRTIWVLTTLIFTVLVALGYYIGLPIWSKIKDAERQGFEAEAALYSAQLTEMDGQRDEAWQALIASVRLVGSEIDYGVDSGRVNSVELLADNRTLIAVGDDGLILVSKNGGKSWIRKDGFNGPITYYRIDILKNSDVIIVSGPTAKIARSTNGGTDWSSMDFLAGGDGRPSLWFFEEMNTIIASSDNAISRSTDNGATWSIVYRHGEGNGPRSLRFSKDRTLGADFVGEDGIIISQNTGASWDLVKMPDRHDGPNTDSDWYNRFRIEFRESEIFLVNVDDEIMFQFIGVEDKWRPLSLDNQVLEAPIIMEEVPLELTSSDGAFTVRVDEDSGFTRVFLDKEGETSGEPVYTFDSSRVYIEAMAIDTDTDTIILSTSDADILASFDNGESWGSYPRQSDSGGGDLVRIANEQIFLLFSRYWGGRGAELSLIDSRYADLLSLIEVGEGAETDARMATAINSLPEFLKASLLISPKINSVAFSTRRRAEVEALKNTALKRANEISTGGYSRDQQRQDFAAFMQTCRDNDETTTACTGAYVELRRLDTISVWEIFAERGPQAILLLFLLATLGGLYRYNIRLSGFYHARADALEMLEMGKSNTDIEQLKNLADVLASENVQFGKNSAPADQAAEIVKSAVAGKK